MLADVSRIKEDPGMDERDGRILEAEEDSVDVMPVLSGNSPAVF